MNRTVATNMAASPSNPKQPPNMPTNPIPLEYETNPKKTLQWLILFKNTTIQNFLEVLYFNQDLKTDILNNFTIWLCSMQLHNCVIFKHL